MAFLERFFSSFFLLLFPEGAFLRARFPASGVFVGEIC